jgi:AmmeMemoRadiSam system protein B
MSSSRQATHAGSWYPGTKDGLKNSVCFSHFLCFVFFVKLEHFLSKASDPTFSPSSTSAIIVPHAGISYCGLTEAHAFKAFNPNTKRVFILGPSHYAGFSGVFDNDFFEFLFILFSVLCQGFLNGSVLLEI